MKCGVIGRIRQYLRGIPLPFRAQPKPQITKPRQPSHTQTNFSFAHTMRSLPWLIKKEDQSDASNSNNPLKRKRNTKRAPEPIKDESPEISSDSDDTTILDPALDVPLDVMIPGYDNDDAYIMVENDLLEAAKQVTRHLHLEAYQNRDKAPVEGDIVRPTTGATKRVNKSNVHKTLQVDATSDEEEEDTGKDVTSLGQLLRRRPAALIPATPIKREHKPQNQKESRPVKSQPDDRDKKVEIEISRPPSRGTDADDEEDEDDEDLDRPRKVSPSHKHS